MEWSDKKKEKLIDYVHNEESLWRKKAKNYRRADQAKLKWREIGKELNKTGKLSDNLLFIFSSAFFSFFTGDEAEKQWVKLKNAFYYQQNHKLPSGSGSQGKYKTKNTRFLDKLTFLRENLRGRRQLDIISGLSPQTQYSDSDSEGTHIGMSVCGSYKS